MEQIRLARLAFQIEVLQNGLRKQVAEIVKASAKGDLDSATHLTKEYISNLQAEQRNANEAIGIVKSLLANQHSISAVAMKRSEVAAP